MRLDVYLEDNDGPVGKLTRDENGGLSFAYSDGYGGRPLSIGIPPGRKYGDAETRTFFANLLQEGARLDTIAGKYRIDRSDVAGLLLHLGKECPGAVSVVSEGSPPGKTPGIIAEDYERLSDAELVEDVRRLQRGRTPRKNVEFSLAGVQSKMAIVVTAKGHILQPIEGTGAPTTHILKVGNNEYEILIENELVCLKTAKALGLPVVECEMRHADAIPFLLIPRYDRTLENGVVRRLHQEDCCQALGLPPSMKYQKGEDPNDPARSANFKNLLELQKKTGDPLAFREAILDVTFFNYLIGNTDAHAKNFALLHKEPRPILAPFYDLVCISMYPDVSQEFAMWIGGKKMWDDVARDEWMAFVETAGVKGKGRDKILNMKLKTMAENIILEMETVIEKMGLAMSRVKLVRDCVGERIRRLNDTMGWDVVVDTDAFIIQGGGWENL